ncbi:MAG: hypothetical protein H0T62_12535 [Parachlamydiaceae bacterium]|nr:hypothetical protein [Parachlamydiaceae bacterium]
MRIMLCMLVAVGFIYSYMDKQNALMEVRLMIPTVMKELRAIQEENIRLQYEIARFESPMNLLELIKKPEFSHLQWPNSQVVDVE